MLTNTIHRERKTTFRSESTVSGGTTTTYVGYAVPNSSESDSVWQIQKIVETVAGSVTSASGKFPNGDNTYRYSWTDRASFTYA